VTAEIELERGLTSTQFADDPAQNARICLDLAPSHCSSCRDFHLSAIMRRSTLPVDKRLADADEFGAAVSLALANVRSRQPRVRVLIAGSTDTGLYVGLLNAALAAGADPGAHLDVTLVDQCETPLEICRRFAAGNGLALDTVRADLFHYSPDQPVDLAIMHGVLTFFPPGERPAFLRHAGDWLAPAGLLISSAQHGQRSGEGEAQERIDHALGNLKRFADEAGIYSAGEILALQDRVRHGMNSRQTHADLFAGKDEAIAFYEAAGLKVESLEFIDNRARTTAGLRRRYSERSIATCSRASK
jgi:SAM-dependent methyltransferase